VTKPKIRCAVYTRKSTEEGLDQDFNTLQAQREACENYIRSQLHQGWECLAMCYDDGGFSGGNTERPALKRLMADIAAGKIDVVLCYKVDRLSRSLLDFTKLMELFVAHDVSFVSITQQIDTSTSMGRLMLHVLMSFAQFEREIISERTRDKMAAARRKGKWLGGRPVLGYDVDETTKKLVVNEIEASQVRAIFKLYLELGSINAGRRARVTSKAVWRSPRRACTSCSGTSSMWERLSTRPNSTKASITPLLIPRSGNESRPCCAAMAGPAAPQRRISMGPSSKASCFVNRAAAQ
jgi:DNA invertase Pin-like site-specific DNA recombinase